ncbi:UNC-like C-terminal-domain-containing protein [Lasiosphaeria ovina]|uniref:UNC-like C-terminal-domain-containing protein n=1 Tax=Lasiosphaeria ovina TaxID=92902 RepID=A0AAE0N3S9_9PEZI|nr:UNC-like C-terminal-domain-containing protein [Lasiosphaeria ovina]
MRSVTGPRLGVGVTLALALLGLQTATVHGSRSAQDAALKAAAVSAAPDVCESKTINYITHTLPQQCLRTAWTSPTSSKTDPISASATAATTTTTTTMTAAAAAVTTTTTPEIATSEGTQQDQAGQQKQPGTHDEAAPKQDQGQDDPDGQDITASSFMSFEEWKEMMLRKSGQDPADIKGRKQREPRGGEREPGMAHSDLDSLGDDGEIALEFDALAEKVSELTASPPGGEATPQADTKELKEEHILYDDGKTQYYRSKDAGKTCKERFSYSSIDAGATVLKTNPGAQNSKAILAENKDTYMLLECRAKNKFVIVELSDDILVDTVVLANFEFFSSMIRKFRISVSDRYPVKMDKWVDLGTFEARNSRDIQPFLVEHPQIYTKYIRIEFLSHYGNEFYCPVSLLRVHGTRMLDSWKEPDSNQDDDTEQIDALVQEPPVDDIPTQEPPTEGPVSTNATGDIPNTQTIVEMGLSPWRPIFFEFMSAETCELPSPKTDEPTPVSSNSNEDPNGSAVHSNPVAKQSAMPTAGQETAQPSESVSSSSSPSPSSSSPVSDVSSSIESSYTAHPSSTPVNQNASKSSGTSNSPNHKQSSNTRSDASDTAAASRSSSSSAFAAARTAASSSGSANPSPTTPRSKTSSTASNAASASPTVQESFFKTVTKRLQHLESNTSLSLQYIEEQSRFLQDVLLKMERKQLNRVDTFLDTLNKTVFGELRNVRTQYDQIWQSTVIALETQREQSQREMVALSSRLNVLADEVVFQKRMAILQSILLLSCLVLVIFSRSSVANGGGVGPGASPFDIAFQASRYALSSSSPPPQPSANSHYLSSAGVKTSGSASRANGGQYTPSPRHQHYPQRQDDKTLPLTPTSEFSREGTPLIEVDGIEGSVGESEERSPDQPDSSDGSLREDDDPPFDSADRPESGAVMADQELARPPSRGPSAMSQLGGGSRKPLPALPEDPS